MVGHEGIIMDREQAIASLLRKVEEVINNNDWPTEDGHWTDDGVKCTCPIADLIAVIREKS